MTAPLKIMHVLAPATFGGLERVVAALTAGHRARGHSVTAVLLIGAEGPEPPLARELREAGVEVMSVALPPRSYREQFRRVYAAIRERRPDVVHSHGYLCDVLVGLGRGKGLAAITTTAHGFTGGDRKNLLYEWLQIRSHRRFDAVVAVSNALQTRLTGEGVRRVHVLRNAWGGAAASLDAPAARAELHVPDGVLSFGWVGRVSHEKGLDVLVRALPFVNDLSIHLTVVGDGPERERVAALATELGVADRITWAGVVPAAGRIFRAFDTLVLSSRTEGTPVTLLEAMESLVPIVTTAVGGVPDVVSPAEALLVPSENPAALAGALRAAVLDRGASVDRAARARQRLHSAFALEPWLEGYERIYRSIQLSPSRVTT